MMNRRKFLSGLAGIGATFAGAISAAGASSRPDHAVEQHERLAGKDRAEKKRAAKGALISQYLFETFIVGASNQFAHAACHAVSRNPGRLYNPLFIYGASGLGKTHLLNAIGNFLLRQGSFDTNRICFVTAEEFTNELINSLQYEKMDDFRCRFRKMDVLLLEDIQFIAGKERTQAEFYHTFNTLYDAKRQIVVTCDSVPSGMVGFEEGLRSRFEWGLIADIYPPDLETRVAILKVKASLNNLLLTDDVAFYLASHASDNVRALEGSLVKLSAFASLQNVPITLGLAKDVIPVIRGGS